MAVLGNLLLYLALVAGAVSTFGYASAVGAAGKSRLSSRLFMMISTAGLVIASILLVVQFVTHDFSNGYVFSYSDRSLPLHYLLSSFYAGQEGSFLFWALCSGLLAFFLAHYTERRKSEVAVMTAFMAVHTFLILLVVAKSPFRSIWAVFPQAPAGQIPADGRGLNPLLQNFWMVIHPPVLFLGFAAMAAPFSIAMGGLLERRYDILCTQALPWLLFAASVLGLGIMLGAYWAYGVLGWGGYWGWDPVENSSLVPWLTSMALVHTLLAQLRTSKFVRTNFLLAILSFLLVVYSTFLTRSGILGDASVHAFTDPGATVYWMLLAFLGLIIISGVGMLLLRRKDLAPEDAGTSWFTREIALGAGTIVLLLSAAVVLFGTSLPIFSKLRVEPSFYNDTNLPLAIIMGLLIGFSLYLQWEWQDGADTLRRSWKSLFASLVVAGLLVIAGVRDVAMVALAFSSIFALFVNVEVGLTIAKGDPRFLGGKIAHAGLALFLLGVLSTGRYASTERVPLPLNAPRTVLGHTMTYTGSRQIGPGKFEFTIAVEKAGSRFTLSPVMIDAGEQGLMRNPDIASFLTSDFYVSPLSLDQPAAAGVGEKYTIEKGATVQIGDAQTTFVNFDMGQHGAAGDEGGMAVGSVLEIVKGGSREVLTPVALYRANQPPQFKKMQSALLNASIQLVAVNVGSGTERSKVTVEVQHSGTSPAPEMLVVEASIKPYINLLWGGTAAMMVGFLLSILKRSREG